jgi:acetyl-CoA carboxylase biotin carboxyl carrier protein
VEELAARTTELADLMDEFRLEEAKLEGDGWKVVLRRKRRVNGGGAMVIAPGNGDSAAEDPIEDEPAAAAPAVPTGIPVNSPMNGIYYASPSPSSPPFVKEGESVMADQVVGLIEAMKVFNEIVAPISGTVIRVVAKNGELVNPGDPLLYIG